MHSIIEASQKHPKPEDRNFSYGTAGFRMKATLLDSVAYRVGLLAALRSQHFQGKTIGVIITASHNVPEDNGIKLVDPMGEMLETAWEVHATTLANAPSDEQLLSEYQSLTSKLQINSATRPKVVFARDTRESGPALVESLRDALSAAGAEFVDHGILTTPQLHYLVRCINTTNTEYAYGEPTEQGYYAKLAEAYKKLMQGVPSIGEVTVDCANGVGGPKLRLLASAIGKDLFNCTVINELVDQPSKLNYQCGADFVKTQQRLPPASHAAPLARCASLDGDADRLVYYFNDSDGTFRLLDGDKIATLAASFIGDLVKSAGITSLKIGVVQTAYANGSSTSYITKTLGLPVVCTPTGVKHLHHAAMKFDCGVYFEANGHGTVVFNKGALQDIAEHTPESPAQATALENLRALVDLINQTVGDALSDLLLVEVILAHKRWGPKEWDGTYCDLPNRLVRVEVTDRTVFKTTDAERRLLEPTGVQEKINALVGKYKQGRAFARASGTEDAVRVYSEAAERGEAEELARLVAEIVAQY
ncbi:Phosphoacetylglucosamine mutase [Wilcoxina mikolae CBS 423.85]|nr:Phosphoacetylglucosamine mutase [Wilcoxina mikolae CBS 423.85]